MNYNNINNIFNQPTKMILENSNNNKFNVKQKNSMNNSNMNNNYNSNNQNNMYNNGNYNMNNQNNNYIQQNNNMNNNRNYNMNYSMNNSNNNRSYSMNNYNMNNQNNSNMNFNMNNMNNNNNNRNYSMNNNNINYNMNNQNNSNMNFNMNNMNNNFNDLINRECALMDDIKKELDSCDPEKIFKNNKKWWENASSEMKFQIMRNNISNKIIEYFEKNIQQYGNNNLFNNLFFKFACQNYMENNNYYSKTYNLSNAENLSLQFINYAMFYIFTRTLLEGNIINKMVNLQQHLINNEFDMAKLLFCNENINNKINELYKNKTNFCNKFLEVLGKPSDLFIKNVIPSYILYFSELRDKIKEIIKQQKYNINQNFFNNQQMMNMNRNFNVAQQMNYNFRAVNTKSPEELDTQIQGTANTIIAERYQIEQDARKYGTPKIKLYFEECLKLLKYFEKSSKNKLSDSILVHIRTNLGKLSANYDDQKDRIEKHELYHEITPAMIRKYVILRYLKESDDLEVRKKIISELTSESMWANNYKHIFNHYQQNTQKLILKSFVSDITKLCKNI